MTHGWYDLYTGTKNWLHSNERVPARYLIPILTTIFESTDEDQAQYYE